MTCPSLPRRNPLRVIGFPNLVSTTEDSDYSLIVYFLDCRPYVFGFGLVSHNPLWRREEGVLSCY